MDLRGRIDSACQQAASFVHQHPWAVCTGLVGLPLAYRALSGPRNPCQPATDFDSFLKQPAHATPTPAAPADATGFAAFLKNKPAPRDPTSFSSFLRNSGSQPQATAEPASGASQGQEGAEHPVSDESVVVTILYGTEYGFSKEIAEKLRDQLRDIQPFWPRVLDMADHPEGVDLSKEQAVFMICSTQGDGVPPGEARDFCEWFDSQKAPQLEGLKYSVLALGDKAYMHYCATGKQLDGRSRALGGTPFVNRVDVNKEDWRAVDGWIAAVCAALPTLGLKTVAETGGMPTTAQPVAAKPKRWSKSRPYYARVTALKGLCTIRDVNDKDTILIQLDLGESGLAYAPGDALGILPCNCDKVVDELLASLGMDGSQLVPPPSWHYEESPELIATRQGDRMTLREALRKCYDLRSPKPDLLQVLLNHLPHLNGVQHPTNGKLPGKLNQQDCSLANGHSHVNGYTPTQNGAAQANGHSDSAAGIVSTSGRPAPSSNGNHIASSNGRHLDASNGGLFVSSNGNHANGNAEGADADENNRHSANGSSPIKPGLEATKADRLQATKQAARLQLLLSTSPEALEAYLEERHVSDVLADFSASKPPLAALLACLRPLLPRLYSISSSMLEGRQQVQATVAVVRYESLGIQRIGVTSTQVGERLQVGDLVPVYMHKNPDFRLPADLATPIIMVGPGTGLAPFRSFMQERILGCQASGTSYGQSVLFFGCRRRDQDFLYGDLLTQWDREGKLTLFTAFSREQGHKVYVQDRIREQADLVWRLLEAGAHFYVCGDAAHMAGSVEAALLDIIAKHKGSPAAAEAYLDTLRAQQRYQRDVWF